MPVTQGVATWLHNILSANYQDVPRSYEDICHALNTYPTLRVQNDVYTYPNGGSALMINILGTIPVIYRGATYHFPVSLWIPHVYPQQPPLVYVTPNDKIIIRPGQHVDPQGQVYHPYISNWAQSSNNSNLLNLLAVLIDIFGKEPPVASKPPPAPVPSGPTPAPGSQTATSANSQSQASPPPPQHQPIPAQQPPRSLPPNLPASSSHGLHPVITQGPPPPAKAPLRSPVTVKPTIQQTAATSQPGAPAPAPPPPPPKNPLSAPSQILPQQGPASPTYGTPSQNSNISRYAAPPPLPSHQPVALHQPHPVAQNSSRYDSAPPLPPKASGPKSPGSPPVPGGQPPRIPTQLSPHNHQFPPQQYPYQHYGPPQPPKPKTPPPDIMDTLDADTTPIIPTLTQTSPTARSATKTALANLNLCLRSRRHAVSQLYTTTLAGSRQQHEALLSAIQGIQSETSSLAQWTNTITTNISLLQDTLAKQDQTITDSRRQKPTDIDELLVAPSVVANQLYSAVCEERALNEALSVLGRALEKGRIPPAVFVRTTRGLGRDLFLKRLLVRKIAKGMGLNI